MPAQVRSFDAIRTVREELMRFAQRSNDGMEELAGEIRRVIDWVEHDRPAFWKAKVRQAYDRVGEARAALNRCLMYPVNDEAPSCTEEKAALKKAQAYLEHCESKQRRVREWARDLRHELHEYEGRMARLRSLVDVDAPKCVALLDRTLDSLERYTGAAPPGAAAGGPARATDPHADDSPSPSQDSSGAEP